jgi:hypothetical protein
MSDPRSPDAEETPGLPQGLPMPPNTGDMPPPRLPPAPDDDPSRTGTRYRRGSRPVTGVPPGRTARGALSIAAWLGWTATGSAAEQPLSIERLNAEGWEIAGYTGTFDNRSSLILFRKRDRTYLVQCSILYDVTRSPRVVTNCYELH